MQLKADEKQACGEERADQKTAQACERTGRVQKALADEVLKAIPKVNILGFSVANINMEETVAAVAAALGNREDSKKENHEYKGSTIEAATEIMAEEARSDSVGRTIRVVTANAEILYHAYSEPKLGELLHSAGLIVPDGIGVVKAAGRLGKPVKGRVAGVDLLWQLAAWAADKGSSIYLLGAARESVEGAASALLAKYPALKIAGWHDGYFDTAEKERLIREIEEKKPDFLFIAMGFPAQDRFFVENQERLPVGMVMGVGGAFDALSGRVQRAPGWIQRMNLEWAYRFAQNPKRLGRIWALPRFMLAVGRQKRREAGMR